MPSSRGRAEGRKYSTAHHGIVVFTHEAHGELPVEKRLINGVVRQVHICPPRVCEGAFLLNPGVVPVRRNASGAWRDE